MAIKVGASRLSCEDVVAVARRAEKVVLSPSALKKINLGRKFVKRLVDEKKVVYGITTGFGDLCDVVIEKEKTGQLQENLIKSHAAGVGQPLSEEVVRAIMLIKAHSLAAGNSGVQLETIEALIALLNSGVHPVIPEKGSLGASGDLAPLAHMTLVLIGRGEAFYKGRRMGGKMAMTLAGIPILHLEAKEGLALINGTQAMCGEAALLAYDAVRLCLLADVAAALSITALCGSASPFDKRIHDLRPHPGQAASADNLRRLLFGRKVRPAKKGRIQDAYSLRCAPQVHGASRDALAHAREVVEREINSVTDNPLIFADVGEVLSGGNFHGQPLALAMDYFSIAVAELADISERRINRLMDPRLSGLTPFLAKDAGVNSGLMIAHYTAASLVSENKTLAHPASVDSIPVSANQEDHVSMGPISVRNARAVLQNSMTVLAIEFLCAAAGMDGRESELSPALRRVHDIIRGSIPPLESDRETHKDIQLMLGMVKEGSLLDVLAKGSFKLL